MFFSEHLTKETNDLLMAAKEKLKEIGLVKFVWPSEGHILIRKDERARVMRIEDMRHLQEIKELYIEGPTDSEEKDVEKEKDNEKEEEEEKQTQPKAQKIGGGRKQVKKREAKQTKQSTPEPANSNDKIYATQAEPVQKTN